LFVFVFSQVVLWVNMKPVIHTAPHDPGLAYQVQQVKKLTNRLQSVAGKPVNPCQTSFSFIETLITMLVGPESGANVLDLGAGTFTTAVVCLVNGHNCTSVEKNRELCLLGETRLNDTVVRAREAFMKGFKAPVADFISVAHAKNTDTSYMEPPHALCVKPYTAPWQKFSYLSGPALRETFVSQILPCMF
jgi:hypothetical protein